VQWAMDLAATQKIIASVWKEIQRSTRPRSSAAVTFRAFGRARDCRRASSRLSRPRRPPTRTMCAWRRCRRSRWPTAGPLATWRSGPSPSMIEAHPLLRNFMPKVGKPPAFSPQLERDEVIDFERALGLRIRKSVVGKCRLVDRRRQLRRGPVVVVQMDIEVPPRRFRIWHEACSSRTSAKNSAGP